jgi:hypothetical protein
LNFKFLLTSKEFNIIFVNFIIEGFCEHSSDFKMNSQLLWTVMILTVHCSTAFSASVFKRQSADGLTGFDKLEDIIENVGEIDRQKPSGEFISIQKIIQYFSGDIKMIKF